MRTSIDDSTYRPEGRPIVRTEQTPRGDRIVYMSRPAREEIGECRINPKLAEYLFAGLSKPWHVRAWRWIKSRLLQ